MNSSPDDQESIRKLLVIKRYEQPPPGFFNSFSDQVISRIQTQSTLHRPSWWQQWFAEISGQPLIASTYALLFAGLFVVALGLAQSPTVNEQAEGLGATSETAYSLREASFAFPPGQVLQQQQTVRSSLDPAAPLPMPGSGLESMLPFAIPSNAISPASYPTLAPINSR